MCLYPKQDGANPTTTQLGSSAPFCELVKLSKSSTAVSSSRRSGQRSLSSTHILAAVKDVNNSSCVSSNPISSQKDMY